MQTFFNKHYILFYILLFLLIGLNIYALLWRPKCPQSQISYMPTPPLNQVIDSTTAIVDCNSAVNSGGQGQTNTIHSLGNNAGTVEILYEMKQVPDRMDVYYNGSIVASTNQEVSGNGRIEFDVPQNNKTNYCEVVISAPEAGTEWSYQISCPQ